MRNRRIIFVTLVVVPGGEEGFDSVLMTM